LTVPPGHTLLVSFPQQQYDGCVTLLAVGRDAENNAVQKDEDDNEFDYDDNDVDDDVAGKDEDDNEFDDDDVDGKDGGDNVVDDDVPEKDEDDNEVNHDVAGKYEDDNDVDEDDVAEKDEDNTDVDYDVAGKDEDDNEFDDDAAGKEKGDNEFDKTGNNFERGDNSAKYSQAEFCCSYLHEPLMYNSTIAYLTVRFSSFVAVWSPPWARGLLVTLKACETHKPLIPDDFGTRGFQMEFSFMPRSSLQRLPSGLWNCSVPGWAELKRHFPCNLQKDCEGGEDELKCPYYRCNIDFIPTRIFLGFIQGINLSYFASCSSSFF
jgi:hypothetical protein